MIRHLMRLFKSSPRVEPDITSCPTFPNERKKPSCKVIFVEIDFDDLSRVKDGSKIYMGFGNDGVSLEPHIKTTNIEGMPVLNRCTAFPSFRYFIAVEVQRQ